MQNLGFGSWTVEIERVRSSVEQLFRVLLGPFVSNATAVAVAALAAVELPSRR